MDAVRRAARSTLLVGAVVTVVVVGLAAHAAAYLVGFTTPATALAPVDTDHGLSHAAPGPHDVGVRHIGADHAPVELTVWYPATDEAVEEPPMRYSYSLSLLGPRASTALATYPGVARLGAEASLAGGPYPLVVLSAGFAITPDSYAWLAEHLASHGLVVAAPRHEETLDPSALWRAAIDRSEVVARTRHHVESAAAPGGQLAGLVDPAAVAVLGHSYGGYTALAVGGAQLDGEAFTDDCAHARRDDHPIVFLCDALEPRFDDIVAHSATAHEPVDAVVSLAGDAAMFGETGLASVTSPLLVVGGTADDDSPYDRSTRLAYDGAASERKVEVALEGAGHFVFAGECDRARRIIHLVPLGFCEDPVWERATARATIRHYVTAFLLGELAEDDGSTEVLAGSVPPSGVRVRTTGIVR